MDKEANSYTAPLPLKHRFQSLIVAELAFQLPCFVLLAFGLMKQRKWTRVLSIIYGKHEDG